MVKHAPVGQGLLIFSHGETCPIGPGSPHFFPMVKHAPVGQGLLILSHGETCPSGPGSPHFWDFTITRHSVGPLWTSDQPDAETSTWQHTTLTRDRHPCRRRDSNPQSQRVNSRRPTA
jgi:hypothetical protein